jgi:hypothetical protein
LKRRMWRTNERGGRPAMWGKAEARRVICRSDACLCCGVVGGFVFLLLQTVERRIENAFCG